MIDDPNSVCYECNRKSLCTYPCEAYYLQELEKELIQEENTQNDTKTSL